MCITQYGARMVKLIVPPPPKPRDQIISLGIDLAGRRLAWCVSNVDKLIAVAHFEAKKAEGNRAAEIVQCTEQLLAGIEGHEIDEVYIEEPYIGHSTQSSLQLAHMCGAVLQVLGATTQLKPQLVPVSTWKKQVLGKGSLDKEGIIAWLETNHPEWLDECRYLSPTGLDRINQDRADAICVSRMAFVERGQRLGRARVRRSRASDRPQRMVRPVA